MVMREQKNYFGKLTTRLGENCLQAKSINVLLMEDGFSSCFGLVLQRREDSCQNNSGIGKIFDFFSFLKWPVWPRYIDDVISDIIGSAEQNDADHEHSRLTMAALMFYPALEEACIKYEGKATKPTAPQTSKVGIEPHRSLQNTDQRWYPQLIQHPHGKTL